MRPDTISALFDSAETELAVLVLSSLRALGFAFVFPLFSWTRIAGPVRLLFAVAVSLPFAYANLARVGVDALTPALLAALVLKELILGAGTGLFLAVPFWGAQAAGDAVDVFRGAAAANLYDPLRVTESNVFGALNIQLALGLFVAAGGVIAALDALFSTYQVWPLFAPLPDFSSASLASLVGLVNRMLWIAAVVAAPLFVAMLLSDLTLVIIGRTASGFQVYQLSVTLKNLVVALLAPLYALFFSSYVEGDWREAAHVLGHFLGLQR